MFTKRNALATTSRSKRGFSLAEMLVAVAIFGIIGAALTSWLMNMNKSTQNVAQKGEFNSLVNEIQGVFNNTGTCTAALSAQPAFSVANMATIPGTFTPAIPVGLQLGATNYAAGFQYSPSLQIDTLNFTGIDRASAGQFVLQLELKMKRLGADGAPLRPHLFNVIVQVDTNRKITGCSGQFTNYWVANGLTGGILYNGTVSATAFMYISDARLKEHVREISSPLERVLKLHGVTYDWKDRSRTTNRVDQVGLLAQDVEKVFPEAVNVHPESGIKSVGYANLIAPIIEALKEQQEIIVRQQQEISEIKKELSKKSH